MESYALTLGWIGIFAPLALGAIGSIVGCTRAGQAACGAMLETESGHGRFVGVSAMPSSQTIYGIVVMLTLNREVTLDVVPGLFAIGVLTGLALMLSGFQQARFAPGFEPAEVLLQYLFPAGANDMAGCFVSQDAFT